MAKVKKPDIKDLKKMAKALNETELTDAIDLDTDDVDELAEGFVSAMEAIDDAKKGDEVPKKIITYHNNLFDYVENLAKNKNEGEDNMTEETNWDELLDELTEMEFKEVKKFVKENGLDFKVNKKDWEEDEDEVAEQIIELMKSQATETDAGGNDDLETQLNDMDYKAFKKFVKENKLDVKVKKASFDDDHDELTEKVVSLMGGSSTETEETIEFDEDALTEELEDYDVKQIKAYIKDNGLEYKVKKSTWEDDPDDDVAAIVALMKAKSTDTKKTKTKKGKKETEETTEKKTTTKGGVKFKANSIQAKMYDMIASKGETTVLDLAVLLNDGSKSDAEKKCNAVCHKLARTIAKKVPITITWSGDSVDVGVVRIAE